MSQTPPLDITSVTPHQPDSSLVPGQASRRHALMASALAVSAAIALPTSAQAKQVKSTGSAVTAPTRFVEVGGRKLAYRTIGKGKPIVLCNRFRGVLDLWDPAFIDGLAG